jgi:hypothetical protein
MPKSRHRKNQKKKAAHRKLMQEHKRKAYQRKMEELYGQELAKIIAEQQKSEGGDPNNLTGFEGLLGAG